MLLFLKTISKLKENWPKNTRNYFIQYNKKIKSKQSAFLNEFAVDKKRVGHPEYLTYVNLENENYVCIGNITHADYILKKNKLYYGVNVGKDKEGKDIFFVIEDIKFKKAGVNIEYLCKDLLNNICKSDVQVSKDMKKVSDNIAVLIESFFIKKGFKNEDIFVHHQVVNEYDFIKQTEIVFSDLIKNEINIKND